VARSAFQRRRLKKSVAAAVRCRVGGRSGCAHHPRRRGESAAPASLSRLPLPRSPSHWQAASASAAKIRAAVLPQLGKREDRRWRRQGTATTTSAVAVPSASAAKVFPLRGRHCRWLRPLPHCWRSGAAAPALSATFDASWRASCGCWCCRPRPRRHRRRVAGSRAGRDGRRSRRGAGWVGTFCGCAGARSVIVARRGGSDKVPCRRPGKQHPSPPSQWGSRRGAVAVGGSRGRRTITGRPAPPPQMEGGAAAAAGVAEGPQAAASIGSRGGTVPRPRQGEAAAAVISSGKGRPSRDRCFPFPSFTPAAAAAT